MARYYSLFTNIRSELVQILEDLKCKLLQKPGEGFLLCSVRTEAGLAAKEVHALLTDVVERTGQNSPRGDQAVALPTPYLSSYNV